MTNAKLLPVLLVFIAHTTNGQVYFEGLYGDTPSSQGIGRGGTVPVEDGYLTWAYSHGNYTPYLFLTDIVGNLSYEMFMPQADTINRRAFNVVPVSDTTFVGLTMVNILTQPTDVQGDFGLVKFRINGDVIWENNFGLQDRYEIPQRVVQTVDNGFAMVGQAMMGTGSSEHGDVYLIRTDANGEQLWQRTYGGSLYDAGISLLQTPDTGFLLIGWTYSYGAGQRDFYLIKTDSFGNQQWQKTYGDSNFDSGHDIISLSDGSYLIGGYRNLNEKRQGYLYKVDELGDVIWENDYGDYTTTEEFHKLLELPNGDIVATGLYDPYGAAPQNDNGGLLVRVSSEGDEIWRRVYQKNEFTDLFYSVLLTEEGGFLLSGVARNTETNSPDAWLLKVDSMGCTFPDCVTGVDEIIGAAVVVEVYPNPFNNNFQIAYSLGYEAQEIDVEIFDLMGRNVKAVRLKRSQSGQVAVELEECLGLYVLRITADNRQVHQQKLVCLRQ